MSSKKKLRLFIASPGDVMAERNAVRKVVDELNGSGGIANLIGSKVEILNWRSLALPFIGNPQETILKQLPVETWDIFVTILWKRFDTPTGMVKPETREKYLSGTEQEILLAVDSWRKYKRPKVLMYRKVAPFFPSTSDELAQYSNVNDFFTKIQKFSLYNNFSTEEDFIIFLSQDLTKVLIEYQLYKRESSPKKRTRPKYKSDYKVFISHSSKDLFPARQISKEIKEVGAETWLDDKNMEAGGILTDQVLNGLRSSNEAVVLLSVDSVRSQWVNAEIGAILALDKRVTPLLINVKPDASSLLKDRLAIHVNELDRYLDELKNRT
jgi:hypothetical protein